MITAERATTLTVPARTPRYLNSLYTRLPRHELKPYIRARGMRQVEHTGTPVNNGRLQYRNQ